MPLTLPIGPLAFQTGDRRSGTITINPAPVTGASPVVSLSIGATGYSSACHLDLNSGLFSFSLEDYEIPETWSGKFQSNTQMINGAIVNTAGGKTTNQTLAVQLAITNLPFYINRSTQQAGTISLTPTQIQFTIGDQTYNFNLGRAYSASGNLSTLSITLPVGSVTYSQISGSFSNNNKGSGSFGNPGPQRQSQEDNWDAMGT